MIRIISFLLLLAATQSQIFRPEGRQRPVPFMRPPQRPVQRFQESPFRFQAAPSNIEEDVRAPPQHESFIHGATPFLHPPRPSMGDLPLSQGPSFGLVPPPSVEERNNEGNVLKQLHQNNIEESQHSNTDELSIIPELPLDEPNGEEDLTGGEVSMAEEKSGPEGEQQPSEPKHINAFEENINEPNSFNPFSITENEEVAPDNDEDGRNKKREANPQEIGANFNFPNFNQGANQRQFHNLNEQGHRAESQLNNEKLRQENQFLPPIYRPDQSFRQPAASAPRPHNLNGFNPPSFTHEEKPKSFGFSDHRLPLEGQSEPKSEFNFNQNINSPARPSFPVRNERPSPPELQENPSSPVRLERPPFPPPRHERPAQPERQERPQPERHERPEPERHERPEPERHERHQPERQERPRPERHERPQPERPERPSPSIRHERPSPPERPSRPERPENIFQSPDHRSEDPSLPKFQFPSFNEAQSNAKPYIPASEVIQTPPRITGQQQLKKGVAIKRKPFKKRQQEPLYQAADIQPNQLFQGYPEEEEDETPDRLSTLLQETSFNCLKRKDGYYADEELSCEVFHFCQDGVKHSWLCPNEGSFHQVHLICLPRSEDNICEKSSKFHFVNDYLYQLAGEGTNQSYVKRYYPDGYTEGIAALEERHAISEHLPPPASKQQHYRAPQQPPRNLYQFNQQQEPPRQVQQGPPLKQIQRQQFVESEDYHDGNLQPEESNDYPVEEEFPQRASPNFRQLPNHRPGRPTSAIASQLANQ